MEDEPDANAVLPNCAASKKRFPSVQIPIIEYNRHLYELLGEPEIPSDEFPILHTIDLILRLACVRRAEEIRFSVTPEDTLDVRMGSGEDWLVLPPLLPVGSALSRLFIVGELTKGEEARSQSQRNSVTRDGVTFHFETTPVRPWREHIVIRVAPSTSSSQRTPLRS